MFLTVKTSTKHYRDVIHLKQKHFILSSLSCDVGMFFCWVSLYKTTKKIDEDGKYGKRKIKVTVIIMQKRPCQVQFRSYSI